MSDLVIYTPKSKEDLFATVNAICTEFLANPTVAKTKPPTRALFCIFFYALLLEWWIYHDRKLMPCYFENAVRDVMKDIFLLTMRQDKIFGDAPPELVSAWQRVNRAMQQLADYQAQNMLLNLEDIFLEFEDDPYEQKEEDAEGAEEGGSGTEG